MRLLGIDAPETHGGPAECACPAATRQLSRLAPAGAPVRLVTDPRSGDTRDRYGRLLAYVEGRRGDSGERQLRAGLALVLPLPRQALLATRAPPARAESRARRAPGRLVRLHGRLPLGARRPATLTTNPRTGAPTAPDRLRMRRFFVGR